MIHIIKIFKFYLKSDTIKILENITAKQLWMWMQQPISFSISNLIFLYIFVHDPFF